MFIAKVFPDGVCVETRPSIAGKLVLLFSKGGFMQFS